MRELLSLVTFLGCFLAATGGAQARFAVCSNTSLTTPTYIFEIAEDGRLLSTLARLPAGTIPQGLVMDADNRSLAFTLFGLQGPMLVGTFLSAAPNGAITTISAGLPLESPLHALRDSEGDWILVDSGAIASRLTKFIHVKGGVPTQTVVANQVVSYAARIDPESGEYIVRGAVGVQQGIFRVDAQTGAVSSFWQPSANEAGYDLLTGREPVFEPSSGAVIGLWSATTPRLARYHPENGRVFLAPQGVQTTFGDVVRADQESPEAYTVLGRDFSFPANYSLVHLRADGTEARRARIAAPSVFQRSPLVRLGSRHLDWRMDRAPNGRSLHVSVPSKPGYFYAAAFSLSGTRPGYRLPDGREIPLRVDALTVLSLTGGIPGVLDRTVGRLDALGDARVRVDTNVLGAGLKGVRLWGAAVVLDALAPSGVSHIVGPTLLQIRQ